MQLKSYNSVSRLGNTHKSGPLRPRPSELIASESAGSSQCSGKKHESIFSKELYLSAC